MPRFSRLPALFATGLAVLAVGCGDDDDDDDAAVTPPAATQSAAPSGTATASPSGGAPAADTATVLKAIETAEGSVSGGRAFEFDADTVNGTPVLEVKVANDGDVVEVAVSPDGADVLGTRSDTDDADDARDAEDAQVTLADAIQAAEGEAGGRTLDSVGLDNDNGTLAYAVSYQGATDEDEIEVAVDAASGDVLGTNADD